MLLFAYSRSGSALVARASPSVSEVRRPLQVADAQIEPRSLDRESGSCSRVTDARPNTSPGDVSSVPSQTAESIVCRHCDPLRSLP
jgi:hypothetical protein